MSNITLGNDGSVNINFDKIKKITIDHLTDIISHRIMRLGDLTTHELEFINQGKCHLSYTKEGKIVAGRITNMNTEANFQDGILILKPSIKA